jgi:glycosyltransferase involved in cell wall biosynthesis
MTRPLLTIVTINHNNASGVSRTVDSFRPFRDDDSLQFLFIDGSSTDNSLFIARTFYWPDEIFSEPDSGIYDAMNKGLSLALGKFVIWINSGDQFAPDDWDELKIHLIGSKAALVAGSLETALPTESTDNPQSVILSNAPERLPFQPLHHQAVFFRRTKAIQYRGYPLSYRITADRALIMAMYRGGELFEYLPMILARYELGGISSDALLRESEGYDLDLELGLISFTQYLIGKLRNRIYHQLTIPVWNFSKSIGRLLGFASLPKPSWLVKLARAPYRG